MPLKFELFLKKINMENCDVITVETRKEGMKKKIYVVSRVNIAVFCTIN